jgi:hypothetical protein
VLGPGIRQHAQRFYEMINAGTTPVLYDDTMKTYDAYMLDSVFFSLIQKSAVFIVDQESVVRFAFRTASSRNWNKERLSELLGVLDSL